MVFPLVAGQERPVIQPLFLWRDELSMLLVPQFLRVVVLLRLISMESIMVPIAVLELLLIMIMKAVNIVSIVHL